MADDFNVPVKPQPGQQGDGFDQPVGGDGFNQPVQQQQHPQGQATPHPAGYADPGPTPAGTGDYVPIRYPSSVPEEQQHLIDAAAKRANVDPRLLLGEYNSESNYGTANPKADPYWKMGLVFGPGKYSDSGWHESGQNDFEDAFGINASMWARDKERARRDGNVDLGRIIDEHERLYAPAGAKNDPKNLNANKLRSMYELIRSIPENEVPLPPHITKATRVPTMQHANVDPTKGHYGVVDEVLGHQELPFILKGAKALDDNLGTGHKYWDEATVLYKKDPAAARATFGDNAVPLLQLLQQHGKGPMKDEAKYLLEHPLALAAKTGFEEWFNPMAWVEGGIFGRTAAKVMKGLAPQLNAMAKYLHVDQALSSAAHMWSPYRAITAAEGPNARNHLHLMAQKMLGRDVRGAEQAMSIFTHNGAPMTMAEQVEIVRQSQRRTGAHLRQVVNHMATNGARPDHMQLVQGLQDVHARMAADPTYAATMASKAAQLRKSIVDMTTEQQRAGVLANKEVYDPQTYFPMHGGVYDNGFYGEDQTRGIIDTLNGHAPNSGFTSVHTGKKLANIDESMMSDMLDMKKFLPAGQLYRYLRSRGANVEFDSAMRQLALKYPNLVRNGDPGMRPPTFDRNNMLRPGKHTVEMIAGRDIPGAAQSPFLDHAFISPELGDWLGRRAGHGPGRGLMAGRSAEAYLDDSRMNMLGVGWDRYNSMMRGLMLYNPVFHPFWNIATNSMAAARAKTPLAMRNYVSALARTVMSSPELVKALGLRGAGNALSKTRDQVEKMIFRGASTYQQDLEDAWGAVAHFGPRAGALGGDAMKVRTLKLDSPNFWDNADKFMTRAVDYNRDATFGKQGEEYFAVNLFKTLTKKWGMSEEDAAWSVREALGNYGNVDPNSWASKLMFFYPWLKSNSAFWMKTFLQSPRFISAPLSAAERYSQATGDPRAYDPRYPRPGTSYYLGQDKEGEDVAYTMPLPYKDMERIANIIDPRGILPNIPGLLGGSGPDIQDRIESAVDLVQNRMMPGLAAGFNTVATALDSSPHEAGQFRGYQVMFNKASPNKGRELTSSLAEQTLPLPVPFLSKDIINTVRQGGFGEVIQRGDRLPQYIAELVGAGYISRGESFQLKNQQSHAFGRFDQAVKRAGHAMSGPNPISRDEYNKKIKTATEHLETVQKNIESHLRNRTGVDPARAIPKDDGFNTPVGDSFNQPVK